MGVPPGCSGLQGEEGLQHPAAALVKDMLGLEGVILIAGLCLQLLGVVLALLVGLQEEKQRVLGQLGRCLLGSRYPGT